MTIKDLILDFQNTAKQVAEIFYKKYGTKELLHAYRSKRIPKNGSIDIIKNYNFHGGGLYVELSNSEIDFDFGEDYRVDGFDSMRLNFFAKSKPTVYFDFFSEKMIQADLDKLEQDREIYKRGNHPGSGNYYWTETTSLSHKPLSY